MNKIPKKLYMIWLGNIIPNYIQFSINRYKYINQDFEIEFIHYTVDEIKQIYLTQKTINKKYDVELLNSINYLLAQNIKYEQFIKIQKNFYGKNIRFIQALSDIFRFEILNIYGGIYVDCDTLPFKQFDENILNVNSFVVQRHYQDHRVNYDNYFFGIKPQSNIQYYSEFEYPILQTYDNWQNDINFLIRKRNFYKNKISNQNVDFYIEHYVHGNWIEHAGKINTPLCFLDGIFNK